MAPNLIDRIAVKTAAPTTYEPDLAYLTALVSAWSYSDRETLTKILRRSSIAGAGREFSIEPHSVRNPAFPVDVNAYLISFEPLGSESPLHLLCFRGTELTNLVDLLTDALVEPHPWPKSQGGQWIHRGFFLSLDVLWPELVEELQGLEGDLYLTGHSLGGALAVLAGRRFWDDGVGGPSLRAVYTFGQPMVGGEAFAMAWPSTLPLFRHVFHRDLVVRLPPRLSDDVSRDYRHFGQVLVPRPPFQGAPEAWARLDPELDRLELDHASIACEGFDILPALLTLITTRAPSVATGLLEVMAQLPRAGQWVPSAPWRLIRGQRVVPESAYALNDHAPTYYVDVARSR